MTDYDRSVLQRIVRVHEFATHDPDAQAACARLGKAGLVWFGSVGANGPLAQKFGGAAFHNDAILVNAVGSGAVRATRIFSAGRKLIKMHQNVLVFCKGDPRKATAWYKGEA